MVLGIPVINLQRGYDRVCLYLPDRPKGVQVRKQGNSRHLDVFDQHGELLQNSLHVCVRQHFLPLFPLLVDQTVPVPAQHLVALVDVRQVVDPPLLQLPLDICRLRLTVLLLTAFPHLLEDVEGMVESNLLLLPLGLVKFNHYRSQNSRIPLLATLFQEVLFLVTPVSLKYRLIRFIGPFRMNHNLSFFRFVLLDHDLVPVDHLEMKNKQKLVTEFKITKGALNLFPFVVEVLFLPDGDVRLHNFVDDSHEVFAALGPRHDEVQDALQQFVIQYAEDLLV